MFPPRHLLPLLLTLPRQSRRQRPQLPARCQLRRSEYPKRADTRTITFVVFVGQSSSLPLATVALAALVPDVADDTEAARDEEDEDGGEHANGCPLVAHDAALQAVEVKHSDGGVK